MARHRSARELLALAGVLLAMAPEPAAAATSSCSGSVLGAVFGTLFATLLVVAVVLVIVWFCCLRRRWLQRHNRGIIRTAEITDGDLVRISMDGSEKIDAYTSMDAGVFASEKQQISGIPDVLKSYMEKCEIPDDSVQATKLDKHADDLDFSVCSHGAGLFVKEVNERSSLRHIKSIAEGMHVLGLSVSFDNWDYHEAARFIAAAAPFKPHLYLRREPLFDVDDVKDVPVTRSRHCHSGTSTDTPAIAVEFSAQRPLDEVDLTPKVTVDDTSCADGDLVVVETVRAVHAAPSLPVPPAAGSVSGDECESIVVSDDDPVQLAPTMRDWTFDRSNEMQPERVISISRVPRSKSDSGSDTATSGTRVGSPDSWRDAKPDDGELDLIMVRGGGRDGDVYRATPISLRGEEEFELTLNAGADLDHSERLEDEPEVYAAMSQSNLALETRSEGPRVASSLESFAIDSGLGSSANVGLNGAHSSSDASQDGRNGLAGYLDTRSPQLSIHPISIDATVKADMALDVESSSPSLSRSSSHRSSVAEAPIECTKNPRQLPATSNGLEHLEELSELDRKIALNNIEIATLMLNDSHDRQLFAIREPRYSESECESAQEEPITATRREVDNSANFGRQRLSSSLSEKGMHNDLDLIVSALREDYHDADQHDVSDDMSEHNLDDVDDEELSNVINRLAESSGSEADYRVHSGTADLNYEPHEAYA